MDYSDIKMFSLMKTKMEYLAARQDVLARSVASVDTPGYKAQDIKPLDFGKMASEFAGKLEMKITSSSHQAAPVTGNAKFKAEVVRDTFETKPVQNSVTLEEQMMKVNETAMDYMTTTNLYSKVAGMFKTAIGRA